MQLTGLFLEELEREASATRRVLERIPEGRSDWKPHEKSMPLSQLATLVATMPMWIALMLNQDFLDLRPPGGPEYKTPERHTRAELLSALDDSVAQAKAALAATNEDHLLTNWQFRIAGNVVSDLPRHQMIRDAVFQHMAHHRGQLTVYLRLNEAKVPAIYGPTADEPF